MGSLAQAYKGMQAYIASSQTIHKAFNGQKCLFHTPFQLMYEPLINLASHEGNFRKVTSPSPSGHQWKKKSILVADIHL